MSLIAHALSERILLVQAVMLALPSGVQYGGPQRVGSSVFLLLC
jgi:hypothetical protein